METSAGLRLVTFFQSDVYKIKKNGEFSKYSDFYELNISEALRMCHSIDFIYCPPLPFCRRARNLDLLLSAYLCAVCLAFDYFGYYLLQCA